MSAQCVMCAYACCAPDVPEAEALLASGAFCHRGCMASSIVWWCRAPALKVLAMDMMDGPNLGMGLLESAGSMLQHLQLVVVQTQSDLSAPHSQLSEGFWRAIKACTELFALQLVFAADVHDADWQVASHRKMSLLLMLAKHVGHLIWRCTYVSKKRCAQICHFLEGALLGGHHPCLPKLASIALYLESIEAPDSEQPAFHVGVPLAPEQGAQSVCNTLGRLVAAGVLPALRQACLCPMRPILLLPAGFGEVKLATRIVQVLLDPCVHDFDLDWRGGRGPQCDGAPAVEVQCRHHSNGGDSRITSHVCLRKPERGSALSEAAQRAYGSLGMINFY